MARRAVVPEGMHVAGIYSPAVKARGELIFFAGIIGIDDSGATVGIGDAAAQTRQALENLDRVLAAAGATRDDVVSLRVFSTDMANRAAINAERERFFSPPMPVSTHVEVSRLVSDEWLVEIEATAVVDEGEAPAR